MGQLSSLGLILPPKSVCLYVILFFSVAVSTMERQCSREAPFFHAQEGPMFSGLRSDSVALRHVWLGDLGLPPECQMLSVKAEIHGKTASVNDVGRHCQPPVLAHVSGYMCKGPGVQLPLSPKFAVKKSHTRFLRESPICLCQISIARTGD